ncbi:MAG: DedA family protein [Rhodocyclaceae bacterium]|nr:MAG: DedA family protein [Rhodocyclaceae bacterium]
MDFLASWMTPEAGLIGLFASAFLSATLLPGASEALLFGLVKLYPQQCWPAFLLASLGNTLGGMSTYALARLLPERALKRLAPRMLGWLQKYGCVALVLSWLPAVGDALCIAAGWLRLPAWPSFGWIALGKTLRYGVVLVAAGLF